jgi:ubiquinone/menaquinone biosynthesis C-methylase UbiE
MTFGQRLARVITDVVVRWPRLWPLFRRLMAKQFDAIAPQWDEFRSEVSFAPYEAALGTVDGPVRDALDVGTGTGEGAMRLTERFPGASIVGVDVSAGMLERARAKVPRARFEQVDAARLPFDDASFDLVTHANMIPFFDELARVLRPGGWALFAFSVGPETPIYVPPERLRDQLSRRGFADFAEFAAGNGTALIARKR